MQKYRCLSSYIPILILICIMSCFYYYLLLNIIMLIVIASLLEMHYLFSSNYNLLSIVNILIIIIIINILLIYYNFIITVIYFHYYNYCSNEHIWYIFVLYNSLSFKMNYFSFFLIKHFYRTYCCSLFCVTLSLILFNCWSNHRKLSNILFSLIEYH